MAEFGAFWTGIALKVLTEPIVGVTREASRAAAPSQKLFHGRRRRVALWAGFIAILTLAFASSLWALVLHAIKSDLHSYVLLVPVVSAYLLRFSRDRLASGYRSSIGAAAIVGGLGGTLLAASQWFQATLSTNDYLTLTTLAYVSFVASGGFLFLGRRWMASAAFPLTFLAFLAPLPDAMVAEMENASVVGSAEVSAWLFALTGTPLLRDGTVFALPGMVFQVAQECSGIRSSWILFITGLVASQLFLRSPWRRLVLVAFVIPLALVRNGFRILVIGLMCVHIGPHMIESVVHRRGGPIFFALSLPPLFALMWWLRRQEQPK